MISRQSRIARGSLMLVQFVSIVADSLLSAHLHFWMIAGAESVRAELHVLN
jgi:hypothetical protein